MNRIGTKVRPKRADLGRDGGPRSYLFGPPKFVGRGGTIADDGVVADRFATSVAATHKGPDHHPLASPMKLC